MITSLTILRDVLESAAYAAQIVGVIVLLYAAYSYLLQRQQLNFDVMTSCTARFQNILPLLHFEVREERDKGEERYVDLCNEQLFYFANDYLPPEVIEEWPDGMVLYLPHHDGEKWISGHGAGAVGKEKLKTYSRVQEAFRVDKSYDTRDDGEREKLVCKVYENIRDQARRRPARRPTRSWRHRFS